MRLATRCLTISEHSSVESIHDTHHDGFDCMLIQLALSRTHIENTIVIKFVCASIACGISAKHLHCRIIMELDELV